MKTIRIIRGVYGHKPVGSRYVEPKSVGEECIVEDAEAARLNALGVAEYVEEQPFMSAPEEYVEEQPFMSAPEEPEEEYSDEIDIESLSFSELKELAGTMGMNIANYRSKKALIDAISNYIPEEE